MKQIAMLIVVLIIGFSIGNFSTRGSGMFGFLNNGIFSKDSKNKLNSVTTNTTESAKDILSKITDEARQETGPAFSKKYLDAMIVAYESSVNLSKIGSATSEKSELRTLAKTIAKEDAITLAKLKEMRDKWYPETKINTSVQTTKQESKPPFVKN
jgi:uncharacterized protein (DUF305 family)